jgi:hypothetical protein
MWHRKAIFVAALVAGAAIQPAGPLTAQQIVAASKSDENSTQEKERKQERELDVRYAKAYLRLTEANLEKYQETNRHHPGTIPSSVMQLIQEAARDASERVKFVEKADLSDTGVFVSDAESDLRAAQDSLRQAEAVNRVSSGSVNRAQVELLKANVDLAKIRVEKSRHLAAEPQISKLHYELEQLREEIQELRIFVALLREKD